MESKSKLLVELDLEGPQALNDNAFETTVYLATLCGLGAEVGQKFFKAISNIDDIWGDFGRVAHLDRSYSAGHTLKIILPFFKAMGGTKELLYSFAQKSLRVVPYIREALFILKQQHEVYIVSTSYSWFVKAYCDTVGFPFQRAYCTRVRGIDQAFLHKQESDRLLDFMQSVAAMPIIEYDPQTGEVAPEHQQDYDAITQFIWETVYRMPIGKLVRYTHPVGQAQKLEACRRIGHRTRIPQRRTVYVGDSQTDLKVVKRLSKKGLTLMFNGKGKVCTSSNLMYIGENAKAITEVVARFAQEGQEATRNYYLIPRESEWGGIIASVTPENSAELERRSVAKRKEFRGVLVGDLT